jgi:hypothetical protein
VMSSGFEICAHLYIFFIMFTVTGSKLTVCHLHSVVHFLCVSASVLLSRSAIPFTEAKGPKSKCLRVMPSKLLAYEGTQKLRKLLQIHCLLFPFSKPFHNELIDPLTENFKRENTQPGFSY